MKIMTLPEFEIKNTMLYYRIFRRPPKTFGGIEEDEDICEDEPEEVEDIIKQCIHFNNAGECIIDASQLQSRLFPTPERTIFISHLHADKAKAQRLRTILTNHLPQYKCFIDSDVWSNVYDVIDSLKFKHAKTPQGYINCTKCIPITQNLHLMLSMALTEAIRSSAAFIYISGGTRTSINTISTNSPWVCQELLVSSLIPEDEVIVENFAKRASMNNITFRYDAPINHLYYGTLGDFIHSMRAVI